MPRRAHYAEAVRIEIRAAEIALRGSRGITKWGELDGWVCASGRHIVGAKRLVTPTKRGELAGYLAYFIYTHKEHAHRERR